MHVLQDLSSRWRSRPTARADGAGLSQSQGHDARDDPIVHPGQPGASHLHSFIGNTATDAASTIASLESGGSTCGKGMDQVDRSAYWVPALLRNGRAVSGGDQRADVYYF